MKSDRRTARPAMPLPYAGTAALQALDLVSVQKAVGRSAYEANPAFGSAGGSLPASVAFEAAPLQ